MKISGILIFVAAGTMAEAGEDTAHRISTVSVYVSVGFVAPDLRILTAEAVASEIFANAGVHIRWKFGRPKSDPSASPILINITSRTPEALNPGALACAQPFGGGHIQIFWDRITNKVNGSMRNDNLLAHVMVHEITHILQRSDRHSRQGIMKAQWTLEDYGEMAVTHLNLDHEDVELIHHGLATRTTAIKGR